MEVGTILNIILAAALFLVAFRDIVVNAIEKDFSQKKYHPIVRMLFSSKEQVAAKKFMWMLGFPEKEDFIKQVKGEKLHNYEGAIKFISECIEETKSNTKYKFGNNSGKKHTSYFYVDSMSFAQKKENCEDLYKLMKHLIHQVDNDYHYVFSIKGGNIPLAVAFSKDYLSIMPKDKNEEIDTGSPYDSLINYEGLKHLDSYAKYYESKDIKGVAITCNLTTGSTFLNAIKQYNDKIMELQNSGLIQNNIKKIENVYILYKVTKGPELDYEFENAGLKCYRYFDLDEDSKSCLLLIKEKKKKIEDFPCYQCIKWGKNKSCEPKHCYKSLKI